MGIPILGANSASDAYDISNSLRFNDDDSAKLSRTFDSSGSRRKFTFSAWVKRANLGQGYGDLFGTNLDSGESAGSKSLSIGFTSSNTFTIDSDTGAQLSLSTSRVFRDPSAWYHFVVAVDTTQGTASNRIKLYVNGVQETLTGNQPSQNLDTAMGRASEHTIGADYNSFFDGYMSEIYYVNDQQYDPTYFGKFDNNGEWIPVEPGTGAGGSITYGTNGFLLEFKQTGTSQNSSGIGADTSGEDHHFAVTNLAATDVTTDTPTNNFCTLNPLSAGSDMRANGSFKEGNCELVNGDTTGESNGQKCSGTMGFANGKWYWEVKLISNTMTAGIVDSSISTTSDINLGSKNAVTYDSETGAINNISGAVQGETVSSQYDDDDIIGVAVDADNGAVYFAKNNTYQNSGNPTSGASKTGGATFTLGNQMLPLAADNSSGSAGNHQYNFGNAPFSISSGNADANGYGNFEYAPPSGYYSLCTKNLAEYG